MHEQYAELEKVSTSAVSDDALTSLVRPAPGE